MHLQREDIGRRIDMTSDGILGPIVLDTDDLNLDDASGFRVTGAYLVGPGTNLELTYFGTFNWASAAQVTGPGNLYSVFSAFGSDPFGGFPETDAANLQRIDYSSALNNAELNLRHRWTSANCVLHGSWLVGARYVALDEDFGYFTQTNLGEMNYLVTTENDLIGAQIGTDMFFCVSPRFKIGGEVEAGVYGNHARQRTNVTATLSPSLHELERDDDVAFVAEAGAIGLFRLTPRLTVRGGYQLIYIDGVALAVENFNTESPFTARQAFLDDGGDVFYHGVTLGFEWTW
jgi:hypothetical protein